MKDPHVQLQEVDLAPYSGEWVAISDSKIIAHGVHVKAVFWEAKKKQPKNIPHLVLVPGNETWIFYHGSALHIYHSEAF